MSPFTTGVTPEAGVKVTHPDRSFDVDDPSPNVSDHRHTPDPDFACEYCNTCVGYEHDDEPPHVTTTVDPGDAT
jgi:hypothetical protein